MNNFDREIADLSVEKRELLEALLEEGDGLNLLPLSFAQQRLWFLDQLEPGSAFYNMAVAVRLTGTLDAEALRASLNEVVRRHESLRTRFSVVGEQPVQLISPALQIDLPPVEVPGGTPEEREAEVRRLAAEEARRPFDLSKGPLLRALLLRLSAGEHVILLTMHHIVSDGWSLGVLVREVAALYEAGVGGESSPLAELPIQYADFAVWQREWLRGEVLDEQLGYWKQQLGGATSSLELPTDRPRSAAQIARGGAVPVSIPAQLTDALKALSLQEGATLFMTLLAAWQTLLRRYANEDDVIVGSPVANRNREEIEDLIGFFVNTLALRTDMSGDPTFREVLRRVRRVTLEAYAHQDIPFEKLVEELQPERSLGRNPFFQVLFALQNAPMGALELPGLTLKLEEFESGTARFELEFHLREHDGGMRGELLYNSDLYDAATAERMVEHFQMLLEGVVRDPDENVSALPLLAEAEEQQLLVEWNRTATPYQRELCVHEMFARQAERAPDEIAILFDGTEVSYRELNRRANRLAHHLQKSGVGPDSVVGICFERSIEMLVSVLGVLKAGGAYLPLDPEYPQARLAFMLADSRARVLLTQSSLSGRVPAGEAKVIRLDAEWAEVEKESGENPESLATPGNLAYVIYTSGSTGKPKGVAMPHRPLVNLVSWQRDRSSQSNPPRTLQFTSLSFDVSFQEIFSTWCVGATLVLIREEVRRDARALLRVLEDARIERLFLPFVALQYLAEVSESEGLVPSNLREVITAGEQLKITRHLRGMFRKMTACTLDNQYGPSEAHVVSSFMLDDRPENWPEVPPIGRPIANAQLYILDEHLRPVPVGVAGELYIGGDCLARGYVGHEGASAEKFVPNPFGEDADAARLYRTGDRARFLRGGDIEFLGRSDRQLKVRGYRVELGEIESALRQHAEVREAVVVAVEDAAGEKRLAAYVLKDERAGATAHELRGHLRERLPEYMVPSVFMLLDEFPLTPSGKVDRRALPTPDLSQMGLDGREDSYVAPRTPVEELLAGIWSEVLGAKQVGVRDNFFESGGHSLLATRLMSRLREAFRVEIPLRSLFEHPTVEGLAQVIKAQGSEAAALGVTPARRASDDEPLPLSFAQQRLWFIDQLNPGSTLYSLPGALRLKGALDVAALQRSIDEVVRRHEAMRTSFATVEGEPVQVVHPFQPAGLPVVDLRHLPQAEREAEASRLAIEESRKPFDLKQWPLLRTALLRLAEDEHVLLFTVHHIIADGWSVAVLVREVAAFYGDFIAGRQPSLPELPIQYGDYALWQREWLRGEVLEEQLGYWKRQLSGASPVLELPTDRPRPAIQSWDGAKQRVVITAALNERLKKLAQREGVTLYMLMLAAFQTLLYRYTRQTDINVGSPIAGRNQLETEGLIGLFINVLIMRAELDGEMSFRELLHRVRQTALEAYARQDLPFEKLVDELQPGRDLSHTPLFQVMFVLQNAPQETPELPGLSLSILDTDNGTSRFDLTLELTERGPELEGFFEYKTELFDASTIARLGEHLLTLLEGIAAEPSQTLSELPLLSADERELILHQWNDTAAAYPADKCVHQLFEEQAARTPDSTAVIFEETQLSYAELNRRANCLAHHLRTLGVEPGARVGICVERSAEMVVGLLGILKAGAAYVPLDPSYPRERLAFMIEDARLSVLLTQESLLDELPPHDTHVLCLDADRSDIARQSEANPLAGATADSLAYVIYTSGSTGRPKGVMVAHRNVANFFAAMDDRVGGGEGSGDGGPG
ncbi:MAG TPA: amino acid adenylation domain-containing protein, partial [Pyrinomonadaceae bacterium]|nr:amino acid adenylation domain-containing protein [Pyrinomonadaceae bacterium]